MRIPMVSPQDIFITLPGSYVDLAPYFVTDLSWLMKKHRIDLWCHGHTHTNIDFIAEGGCRVISNQLGYPQESTSGLNKFREHLVIEI